MYLIMYDGLLELELGYLDCIRRSQASEFLSLFRIKYRVELRLNA